MIELTDKVITIQPFSVENAEDHLKGEDDEQIKWLSGGKSTLESIKSWISKNQKHWEIGGPIFNFAVFDHDSKLVGMVEANTDFKKVEGIEKGDANISYGLYPKERGKGYASRAVNLIIIFLKERGFKRAVIRINPKNIFSLKVPKKCGFSKIGSVKTNKNEQLIIFVKYLH